MKAQTLILLAAVGLVTVVAASKNMQRIVGGTITTVNQYPYAVSLLYSNNLVNYWQACGGTFITTSAILSAAHCTIWRARVGSSYANSGGTVYNFRLINNHPNFNRWTYESDIAVLRTSTSIYYSNVVRSASIAGSNYILNDNLAVWAIGWGRTSSGGMAYEQLRHVQIWTVDQNTCRQRYAELGRTITDNMLCAGWPDVGGRDQCQGDSGGPLIHNGVVVGVCSWRDYCGLARYPGIKTRVSRYTTWIQQQSI